MPSVGHPFLHALFTFFLPELADLDLVAFSDTGHFDFAQAGRERTSALKFQSGPTLDFLFLANHGETPLALDEAEVQNRFRFYFGKTALQLTVTDAGARDLSRSTGDWKTGKLAFTFQRGGRLAHLYLPTQTFLKMLHGAGFSWAQEADPGIFAADPASALARLETGMRFSRNQLAGDFTRLVEQLDQKEFEELLSVLLGSGLVSPAHLASWLLFHPGHGRILESVSSANAVEVGRYRRSLAIPLASEPLRTRWQRQLHYFFHHLASRLFYQDHRFPTGARVWLSNNGGAASVLRRLAVKEQEETFPLQATLGELVKCRQVNRVLSKDCRELLMRAAAHRQGLDLEGLYGMFGPIFREDMAWGIEKERSRLGGMAEAMRGLEEADTRGALIEILLREVESRLEVQDNPFDAVRIHGRLAAMSAWELTRLYHTLGFEGLRDLFDVLRHHVTSPLSDRQAEAFCEERLALLPGTEASIVHDLFHEEMNRDRPMTPDLVERHFARLRHKVYFLSRVGRF